MSVTNDPFSVMEDNLFQHYLELNIKGINGLKRKRNYNKLNSFHFMSSLKKLSFTQISQKNAINKIFFNLKKNYSLSLVLDGILKMSNLFGLVFIINNLTDLIGVSLLKTLLI